MAIKQAFISLDNYFMSSVGDKIIINNLPIEDIEMLRNTLMTVYDKNVISMVPRCACGERSGAFQIGSRCPDCDTLVESVFSNKDPLLWFMRIDKTEKFISPIFWTMVRRVISSKTDILRWIGDSGYNPKVTANEKIAILAVQSLPGFYRGYNFLVQNLEVILETIAGLGFMKSGYKNTELLALVDLYRDNKDKILSDYLPVLNKRMFVMEKTTKGKYTNIGVAALYDVVISFIYGSLKDSQRQRENIMCRTTAQMAEINADNITLYLSSKTGAFRKHIFATRSHFTGRMVIVPMTGPHVYDEIHLPWGIGVTLFRPHLLNLLKKKGYNYKQSINMIFSSVQYYNEVIAECLDELVINAKGKGIPFIIQRNPSLLQGSVMKVYCTKFKKDPADTTMNISILLTKLPNADFDGDELNITLLIDELMADAMETFAPHHSTLEIDDPSKVSGRVTLSGPMTATISNYINEERKALSV